LKIVVCPFVPFLLAIVLSVLLRFTDSDYSFGTFKIFLKFWCMALESDQYRIKHFFYGVHACTPEKNRLILLHDRVVYCGELYL